MKKRPRAERWSVEFTGKRRFTGRGSVKVVLGGAERDSRAKNCKSQDQKDSAQYILRCSKELKVEIPDREGDRCCQ
jgi:hypothetical protein